MVKPIKAVLTIVFPLMLFPLAANAGLVTVFSGSGFVLPETITLLSSTFGTAPAGSYLVPDATANELFVLPAAGGAPVPFANLGAGTLGGLVSGVFVPSGYGSLSGQFLVSGTANTADTQSLVLAVNASGVVTPVPAGYTVAGDTVAPAGFGSAAGEVLLGNAEGGLTGQILTLNPDGSTSVFATLGVNTDGSAILPLGLGFAPSGFGSVGGDLLATDEDSGNIFAINSSGNVSLFATLPVPSVDGYPTGLREMAFAPAGFGAYGGDLFVSVSGSPDGGGTSGSIDVLNGSGALVAVLLQGTVGAPFDPRGLYFVNNNQLLIADADPGILSAPADAFTTATPEPATTVPIAVLLVLLGLARLRYRRQDSAR